MYNPFSLNGKTILVTGASSGIGRATAIECSKMGATLILTGRNPDRLKETYQFLDGNNHHLIEAELTVDEDIERVANEVPNLNCLVHNAGINKLLPFQFVNRKQLANIYEINFYSPILLTQKLIKQKKIIAGGSIVFVSSIDGNVIVHPANSIYASSKGAISAMAKNIALDLSVKGIRVNCVLPGMIETRLMQNLELTQEQIMEDINKYPLKRYGKPEEVAFAIIYLLSDASSWVTGSNLVIDGGYTIL